MTQKHNKKVAVMQCLRGRHAETATPRKGLTGNCKQILVNHPDGTLKCKRGCLDMGDCVTACKMDAVRMNGFGTADMDRDGRVSCGLCVKACLQSLIHIATPKYPIYPACVNQDMGAWTRKDCPAGYIACSICVRNCPAGAVRMDNGHAVIDEAKCIVCGMCAVKCSGGIILDVDDIFTTRAQRQEE